MSWLKRTVYFFCTTCRPNRSGTVRYAFPVIFGTLLVLGAAVISSDEATTIQVVPSTNSVRAGDKISIDVFVDAKKPVNAIDIELSIPKSQLQVTGIDTGESVITLWTVTPYEKDGKVYLRGGTFRKGFLGKHLIATINAKAVNSGLAYINITDFLLLAGDGTGSEVPGTLNSSSEAKLYIADELSQLDITNAAPGTVTGAVDIRIVTDINGDGEVTLSDISAFMAAWQTKSTIFDFSGDGKMTFTDFAIILADSFFR